MASEINELPTVGPEINNGIIPTEGVQYILYFDIVDADTGVPLITDTNQAWYIPVFLGTVPSSHTDRVRISYKLGEWEGGETGEWTNITDLIVVEYDIGNWWNFLYIPRQGQNNYTISIYKKVEVYDPTTDPTKSKNNFLSNLEVERGVLEPAFTKDNTEYKLQLGADIDEMTIYATAEDELAEVDGVTITPLSLGENKITIKVTAENTETRDYHIYIMRGDEDSIAEYESNNSSHKNEGGEYSGRYKTKRDLAHFSKVAYVNKKIDLLTNTSGLTIEQILNSLTVIQREQIYSRLKQQLPYTALSYELTEEKLKIATGTLFSDDQIKEMIKKPDYLKTLGIGDNSLVHIITLTNNEGVIYSDIGDEDEGKTAIEEAISLGILKSTPEGVFNPDENVTIETMFEYLDKVLLLNNITDMKLSRSNLELYYKNISLVTYPHIGSIASKLQITTNSQIGEKKIGDNLTRQELAQVIYEVTEGKLGTSGTNINIEDIGDTAYENALRYCANTGILTVENNCITPSQTVTRREAIQSIIAMNKCIKAIQDTNHVETGINTNTNINNTGAESSGDGMENYYKAQEVTTIGSKYYMQ